MRIRYFAAVREAVGRDEEIWDPPPGTTVREALDELGRRHPGLGRLRPYLRAAVNLEIASEDAPVGGDDELAVLPPLAGGAGGLFEISEAPLSIDRAIAAVRGPGVGALVVFVGLVRAENEGRAVSTLEYEAYPEMAMRQMQAVIDSVEADFPGARLAALHRTGRLAVGEIAVVVVAGAGHRDPAFAAARALIDRVKERVPLWKREVGPDGVHWVGLPAEPVE